MSEQDYPKWYKALRQRHPRYMAGLEALGAAVHGEGPLDEKTAHLVQLAASAAIRSEGAVHSHARRALQAGATADELRHTLILLTSTIGFPNVAAALSWVEDVLREKPQPVKA